MLNLHPFHALRPQPQHFKKWIHGNIKNEFNRDEKPFNFYNLINPSDKKHQQIRERISSYVKQKMLVNDLTPSLYCYRSKHNNDVFEGIIGLLDTKLITNGQIVPHEGVVNTRVSMFKNYLKEVLINTEPILLSHENNDGVNELKNRFFRSEPFAEFEMNDTTHSIWRIEHPTLINQFSRAFNNIKSLLLIDGHHRCYSSLKLSSKIPKYSKMLVCLVSEDQLKIDSFCRLFTDLNKHRPDHFLAQLSSSFNVTRLTTYQKPHDLKSFSMYLENWWYKLYYKSSVDNSKKTLEHLPTQIIYKHLAKPLLGIHDLQKDARISYQYHKDNKKGIEQAVDSKKFKFGIEHFPISLDLVKRCLSEGALLPPKSTYVFPKLLNGLLIYDFKNE